MGGGGAFNRIAFKNRVKIYEEIDNKELQDSLPIDL
jgi:hypothetical protein